MFAMFWRGVVDIYICLFFMVGGLWVRLGVWERWVGFCFTGFVVLREMIRNFRYDWS